MNISKKKENKSTRNKTTKKLVARDSFIKEHVKNNVNKYFIVGIIFLIGLIIGIMFIKNISVEQRKEIVTYIEQYVNIAKTGEFEVDLNNLLKQSIWQNVSLCLIMWFVGSTVIGMPILLGIIGYRGFLIGYTTSCLVGTLGIVKGSFFAIISMLLQNIIFIPCILALGVSGFKVSLSILKNKTRENAKTEIYRHTLFSLVICILMILSSLIETYLSSVLLQWYTKVI